MLLSFVLGAGILSLGTANADAATSRPKAANGTKVVRTLHAAIAALPVAEENGAGYQRARFRAWDDADGDCQNTRAEVLVKETRKAVVGRCTIKSGLWVSDYDGLKSKLASRFEVDHMVPLAEAWASGARAWDAGRREAYANDLADSRTLIAVSKTSNRAKSDQDPAEWLPLYYRCRYIRNWVAIKLRWGLSVDPAEQGAIVSEAATCPNSKITYFKAKVIGGASKKKAAASVGVKSFAGSGTDPRFSTCADAKAAGYGPYYVGKDPEYEWYRDADSDGIVCE